MSQTHNDLYHNLVKLTEEPDSAFQKVVLPLDDKIYHAFTYQLPSFSDFKKSSARESRGILFEVNEANEPIRLASLTPAKFFNYKENPFTMNLDTSKIDLVMNKFDGSMMSTFLHHGQVRLKSKANLTSEHAVKANEFLYDGKQSHLQEFLQNMAENDFTVTMEHVSPENEIVLKYDEERLVVLSARDHETMETVPYDKLKSMMELYGCQDCLVENLADEYKDDFNGFLNSVKNIKDYIEGFVVTIKGGETFKLKTDKYHHFHKNKDSLILSPKNLFESVILETSDDLKALYSDQPEIVKLYEDMEDKVRGIYHDYKNIVVKFFDENRNLEKRDYAVKAKGELPEKYFIMAINCYLRPDEKHDGSDIAEYLMKNYKNFGVKDTYDGNTEEMNGKQQAKKVKKTRVWK